MRKVGVLYHPRLPAAAALAEQIAVEVERDGGCCWLASAWEENEARQNLAGTDFVVTLGGDGTILRASRVLSRGDVPILTVNFGKLGFLSELKPEEVLEALPYFLAGNGWIEKRIMLFAELPRELHAVDAFGNKAYCSLPAANDVVLARGALPRMTCVDVIINGTELTSYRCDGLIVSTPTGSTSYSLSVGGPVLHPESHNLVLVPIAPHLCFSTPIVVPADVEIEVRLKAEYPATLSIDGQIDFVLDSDEMVKVRRSEHPALYLRRQGKNYFYKTLVSRLSEAKT